MPSGNSKPRHAPAALKTTIMATTAATPAAI